MAGWIQETRRKWIGTKINKTKDESKRNTNQNGKVERSNRTDQEMFYERNVFKNLEELKQKIRTWNTEHNNLEHCALNGKSPNEILQLPTINKPTNIRG